MLEIDAVERTPFGHVGEHDEAVEDVAEAEPRLAEHRSDIGHRLPRLRLDPVGQAAVGPGADLAGKIEDVADPDGGGEGKREAPGPAASAAAPEGG